MSDYMVRASAADDTVRAFAVTARDTVEKAKEAHNTSPIATAALGRTLSAAAMMGWMMKEPDAEMTLQLIGDGPLQGVTVTADAEGHVKGLVNVTDVVLPARGGKLDVGGGIGKGILRVIRDLHMKEPYVGVVPIQTGEIAEDLTYYFAVSEQTPSSVGLGVLMTPDNEVDCAGGFILQLMPEAEDAVISRIEENIQTLPSVTDMLKAGKTPEGILETVLAGIPLEILERHPVEFRCDCSRKRIESALSSLSKTDLTDMIEEKKPVEVRCHFCGKKYVFTPEDLSALLAGRSDAEKKTAAESEENL